MPYDSVFISNHRPCYIDLDASILFHDQIPNIEAASRRGLQLQDPRIVKLYHDQLSKQLNYHKIQKKIDLLYINAQQSPHDPTIPLQYEKTEKQSAKKHSDTFQWSPTLATAVNVVRYWRLCIKQLKGVMVSEAAIRKAAEAAKLSLPEIPLTSIDILNNLREAH